MSHLAARHLTKRYQRGGEWFAAVDDASISVSAGELVAVVGRSGSGKTTLLNLVSGLAAPDQGEALIDSVDIHSLGESELTRLRRQKIGHVPQGRSLLGSLTALDNVRLPHFLAGRGGDGRERALSLMAELGVDHLAESLPKDLSGGEIRRLALARALMGAPALLVCDEPTSDLDEDSARGLMAILRRLAHTGTAVLMATHDKLAAALSDRTLVMAAGRLGPLENGHSVGD